MLCAVDSEGIHPSQPGHNIGYRHTIIGVCNTCTRAQVERLFHDCFDFEEVFDQYTWYVLDTTDTEILVEALKVCAHPLLVTCDCSVHSSLRAKCNSLPRSFWSMGIESDASHVYHIGLPDILDITRERRGWFKHTRP